MREKKRRWLLIAVLILGLIPWGMPSLAEGLAEAEGLNEELIARIMAAYPSLNLTEEAIRQLLSQGYGYGEVVIAAEIASQAGKDFTAITALREEGLGWGEIAKELGLDERAFGQAVSRIIGQGGGKKPNEPSKPGNGAGEKQAGRENKGKR